jgi:hypothetical protein
MLDKSCRENQNAHFIFNQFFFENRAIFLYNAEKTQKALLRLHGNSDYTNAQQCYIIR